MNFLKRYGKIAAAMIIFAVTFVAAKKFGGRDGLFMAASVAVSGGIVFFLRKKKVANFSSFFNIPARQERSELEKIAAEPRNERVILSDRGKMLCELSDSLKEREDALAKAQEELRLKEKNLNLREAERLAITEAEVELLERVRAGKVEITDKALAPFKYALPPSEQSISAAARVIDLGNFLAAAAPVFAQLEEVQKTAERIKNGGKKPPINGKNKYEIEVEIPEAMIV